MYGGNLASLVQSLIIASLLVGAGNAASRAQDRWPPWQNYGEAEAARKPHLKRPAKANEQKVAPAQPTEQKTSAPPEPNASGQTERRPGKPPAVAEPATQPQRSEAKQTVEPSQGAAPLAATVAPNTPELSLTEVKPKIEIVPQIPHSGAIKSFALSTDGTRVLSGSEDGTMKLWDAATGALLRTFGDRNSIGSVAFSPDGARVLSGAGDAKLWDAATGALLRTFEGDEYPVTSVAFSPDGTRILSDSLDGTLKLWDAATGAPIRTFEHAGLVTKVAFSPDVGRSGRQRNAVGCGQGEADPHLPGAR